MPTPPDGFPRSLCPPPPLRPRTAGARADPPFPLTCPPELRRRAPAPARPAPAPQPQDPRVQAAVAPREPSRRPPSPEVFHLTSAFAASQMLKIPRHLSPGAYQGAEEGGRRTGGLGIPTPEPGGAARGAGGCRRGWVAGGGTGSRGEAFPLRPLSGAGRRDPPGAAGSRGPGGRRLLCVRAPPSSARPGGAWRAAAFPSALGERGGAAAAPLPAPVRPASRRCPPTSAPAQRPRLADPGRGSGDAPAARCEPRARPPFPHSLAPRPWPRLLSKLAPRTDDRHSGSRPGEHPHPDSARR